MSEPAATLDPLTPRVFLWGWPVAVLASVAATYWYVSGRDTAALNVMGAGWVFVAYLGGMAWRWQRWRDVHVSWRASTSPARSSMTVAPARTRPRGWVGRDDRIAWFFAVGLAALTALMAVAAFQPDGPPVLAPVLSAAFDGLCWLLALAPRVVVTPSRVSVRSLFGRTEMPRRLVAAMTTRSVAPYPMADSYIRIDLTDGTELHFNTGPTVVGKNAPAGLLNFRPPKIRVARRLARLLDQVPVDTIEGTTVERCGRPWVATLLTVFAVVGVGALVALVATAS